MSLFTLKSDRWYACEFFDRGFSAEPTRYSPIRVVSVAPLQDGAFSLSFYDGNYPEGGRERRYRLQAIARGGGFLLARSLDRDRPTHLRLKDISSEWLCHHLDWSVGAPDDLQQGLDREAGFGPPNGGADGGLATRG